MRSIAPRLCDNKAYIKSRTIAAYSRFAENRILGEPLIFVAGTYIQNYNMQDMEVMI